MAYDTIRKVATVVVSFISNAIVVNMFLTLAWLFTPIDGWGPVLKLKALLRFLHIAPNPDNVMLVLTALMLIVPILTAGSISGEKERQTLAGEVAVLRQFAPEAPVVQPVPHTPHDSGPGQFVSGLIKVIFVVGGKVERLPVLVPVVVDIPALRFRGHLPAPTDSHMKPDL